MLQVCKQDRCCDSVTTCPLLPKQKKKKESILWLFCLFDIVSSLKCVCFIFCYVQFETNAASEPANKKGLKHWKLQTLAERDAEGQKEMSETCWEAKRHVEVEAQALSRRVRGELDGKAEASLKKSMFAALVFVTGCNWVAHITHSIMNAALRWYDS